MDLVVRISRGRALELRRDGVRLGSSFVPGEVEVRWDGVYVGGRLLVFRRALKCPVKVGGVYLCGGPAEVPRFFYREVFTEGLGERLRLAELFATDRLNGGDCLAEYLYALARGAPFLWSIYRRGPVERPRRCGEVLGVLVSRGLRERVVYEPPPLGRAAGALLGLLRFSEALGLVERSWLGLAVALRYGIYGALRWDLPRSPDMWLLLFGIYAALDPVVVPGGVALDLGLLRALPYIVARVLGRWVVAFNVAGLRMAAGNINMMVDGGRKRARYASCDGDRCVVGDLHFNICVELECGVFRTWDFEFKGPVKCRDLGLPYVAVEPCK
ncbi:MAG: hypothetical protein ACP5J0_01455 [Pyrobaculum sp.]